MSRTFTDDAGKKWQLVTDDFTAHGYAIIEPHPEPARTESEIMRELDRDLHDVNDAYTKDELLKQQKQVARLVIKAARELARMDLEKREK